MDLFTILLLGSLQAAFLLALILGKREKTLSDWVLVAWMAVLGVHHLLSALVGRGVLAPSIWISLNAGVPLLQGPFLYVYTHSLTSGRRRLSAAELRHLIPFGLFGAFLLWGLSAGGDSGAQVPVFRVSVLLTVAILASVPAYAIAAWLLLRRHRSETLELHSEPRWRDLNWLRWIVLTLLAVWTIVIATAVVDRLAPQADISRLRHSMMAGVTLFIYVIGYFGVRQMAVAIPEEPPLRVPPVPPTAKYARSGLGSDEIDASTVRLIRYLDEEKPHLEEGITLRQVAERLGVSPNQLSQTINQGLGKNFYELINERRVDEFKRRVRDPGNRAFTLLGIAMDSGFSSKSSFNRVFKQFTGLSPQQYAGQTTTPDA